MESNEEDDFQSVIKRKSKPKSKRKYKLSNKHRSKSQKEDVNEKEDCDLFSPVSCSLTRKNSRTNDAPCIIIVSDDENDNVKAASENLETIKDNQVELENNRNESNNLKNELLNDFIEENILSNDSSSLLIKNYSDQGCKKEEKWQNKEKTVNEVTATILEKDIPESLSVKCGTSCSSVVDSVTSNISAVNDCGTERFEHNDIDKSDRNSSESSKKVNSSPLSSFSNECGRFSESFEINIPSSECGSNVEHKNQDAKDLKNSNHLVQESVNKIVEEDTALYPESKIKSLSLEHLNDCTSHDEQSSTSKIKHELNSEKISEVPSISHNDSDKLYSCPLCWKTFENSQSHMVHMKECASRHNLTTRQLLDALELQEKQSAERLALGLPNIQNAQVVKKPAKKKTGPGNDSNLQLALALSVSLQEAEEKEQFKEDECLIEAGLGHEVVERQKTMLERFGFTNSKPALPSASSRSRQGCKNKNKSTVLTQRTKEERERLITEKVAIILIGEENNSSSSVPNDNFECSESPIGVMDSLQKYETKSNSLWNAVTTSCNEGMNHYVEDLSNIISPCKIKAGEKIKHLSQVPGRNITPIEEVVPANYKIPQASTSSQADETLNEKSERLSTESKNRQSLQSFFTGKDTSNKRLGEMLINDWRAMLNKKTLSDIKIFVKSEKEIHGHRLVFYARCRSILRDIIIENKPEKSISMLMWVDISFQAAIAFLQFIYCGLTTKILRLDEQDLSDVRELAQRYRVTELLEHLKIMNKVRAKVNKQSSPNSSQFYRASVTPSVSFSPLKNENISQNDSPIQRFSHDNSESLTLESCKKDELSNYTPSKFSEEGIFKYKRERSSSNSSRYSTKSTKLSSKSNHVSEQINTSPISSKSKSEKNIISISRQDSTSPDLFIEEENEEKIQGTSSGLSQENKVDVQYILRMFDICLTQNTQEAISQQKSPVKLNSSPSTVNPNKISSPDQKNKSLSSPQLDKSKKLTVNTAESPLKRTLETNFSINETSEVISSLSLDTHNEQHNSVEESQLQDKKNALSKNDTNAIHEEFDCVNFLETLISDSPNKKDVNSVHKQTSVDSKRRHSQTSTDSKRRYSQTSVDSKRRYSGSDSSNDNYRTATKKFCQESSRTKLENLSSHKSELNHSNDVENNIIDTLDLTQDSNELHNSQPCSPLNDNTNTCVEFEENLQTTMQDNISNNTNSNKVIDSENDLVIDESKFQIKSLESETVKASPIKETSVMDNKLHQDDWDSFDEMCNAAPEIFSQSLNKLISSQNTSSNSEKNGQSSLCNSQKQISGSELVVTSPQKRNNHSSEISSNKKVTLEETLIACLNESILWRDENAPSLKSTAKDRKSVLLQEHKSHKTPIQQQKNLSNENVTPPVNYSAMKTPELKKELNRFGLKPSLTKKQAKIMLRYIYDQLHPFITVSDSEDSVEDGDNSLPPSPFKIPDKNTRAPRSPTKRVKRSLLGNKENKQNSISVRRSLASQIDTDSDCDVSQESSSGSRMDVAEEMLIEDLEGLDKEIISGSQDGYCSDILQSVVQSYIIANPELHQKVLQHEPIWLEEFFKDLKAQNNYKFKIGQLMDYFDEQCITFRSQKLQENRQKKRQRKEAKKKKSPAKKKGRPCSTKSAGSSTLNSPSSSSN